MKAVHIKLEELVEDFDVYPRTMISGTHVARLRDAANAGAEFPPIVADNKSKRIVDGMHRVRVQKILGKETILCELREYKNDAELFSDAVRLNASHGRPLGSYEIKRSIETLRRLGVDDKKIITIVRIPPARVIEIVRNFAMAEGDGERAVKAAYEHEMAGQTMTEKQEDAHAKLTGMSPTFHLRQVIIALESGMWTPSPAFIMDMDRLTELWKGMKKSA
jgi:ParB-like chromosome segregation protein Spo0J